MEKKTDWSTISIPKGLKDEIARFIDEHRYYYRSVGEFVRDACRKRLEHLKTSEIP